MPMQGPHQLQTPLFPHFNTAVAAGTAEVVVAAKDKGVDICAMAMCCSTDSAGLLGSYNDALNVASVDFQSWGSYGVTFNCRGRVGFDPTILSTNINDAILAHSKCLGGATKISNPQNSFALEVRDGPYSESFSSNAVELVVMDGKLANRVAMALQREEVTALCMVPNLQKKLLLARKHTSWSYIYNYFNMT